MGFQFSREGAVKSGNSEYISDSGVYFGKFIKAYETTYDSQAVSITFDFVSNTGEKSSYLRIFTAKKGGQESFGANHIYALMGLLRLASVDSVKIDDEHVGYPMFCNKPIGLILQRENKEDGKYQMNILHFIDPITQKTFSEQVNNEEAKEAKKEIKDKDIKAKAGDTSFNFGANNKAETKTSNEQLDAMFGSQPNNTQDLPPWETTK